MPVLRGLTGLRKPRVCGDDPFRHPRGRIVEK